MWNIIKAEWLKIRRCQILLVGIVSLALCPIVQYGSQLVMTPEYRDADYDFARLFANVIWGNSQIFLPISLVMIGGWFIDREWTHDTLKNVVTVPVSMMGLLGAKLFITGIIALFFGLYSALVTLFTGIAVGLPGLSPALLLAGSAQVIGAAFNTCLVCLPMILVFGQIRGAYLGGSVFTFFLGYSMLFFKSGLLLSAYPFSAALILVGFDMSQYNGASSPVSYPLAAAGLLFMLLLTALLLILSNRRREETLMKSGKARRKPGRGRATDKRGGRRR